VKLDKLVKQLKRDVTASPKKAAALALMLLVALYFWAPLVWKWFVPTGDKAGGGQTAGLILTDEPPTAGEAEASGRLRLPWEEIRQVIQTDPRMTSAALDERWPDPFARPAPAAPAAVDAESPEAAGGATAAAGEPREASLVVTSIAISRRRKSATINGDTYEENDTVPSGADARETSAGYRIVRIERQAVTLERDGRTLVLELSRPGLAQGDEIQRLRDKSGR